MKNYNQMTQEFCKANGLKRVKVKCPATGEDRLRHVNERQYKALVRSGRTFTEV